MSKNILLTTEIWGSFIFISLNLDKIKKCQEKKGQQRLSLPHLCVFKLRRGKLVIFNLQYFEISTIKNYEGTEFNNPTYYTVHFPSTQKAC